jgi:hypothetical protein
MVVGLPDGKEVVRCDVAHVCGAVQTRATAIAGCPMIFFRPLPGLRTAASCQMRTGVSDGERQCRMTQYRCRLELRKHDRSYRPAARADVTSTAI